MKIALFYNPSPGTVGEYFHKALLSLGEQVDHFPVSGMNQALRGYDVYLRVDHGDYNTDLPADLRPRAFYAVDTHLARSWKQIHRLAKGYDWIFCAQRQAARRLGKTAFWVPLGCDPQTHASKPAAPAQDLAFVGNDGGVPRKFILQELRERHPNSFIGRAPYSEMARIYGQAKIGFHYIECTSPLKDHVSMRVYEILCSGSMLLANALAPGTFESLGLRDREHLVLFRNPRELFQRLEEYLRNDEERRRIAAAGNALVLRDHTYRRRAEQIVGILRERLGLPS